MEKKPGQSARYALVSEFVEQISPLPMGGGAPEALGTLECAVIHELNDVGVFPPTKPPLPSEQPPSASPDRTDAPPPKEAGA